MSKPFKKDDGKPMVELVLGDFATALLEVAKVGTMGAKKYSPHGWKEASNGLQEKIDRIADAKGRHRLYHQAGEIFDPESGLRHRAHEAWNVLAQLTLEIEEAQGEKEGEEEGGAFVETIEDPHIKRLYNTWKDFTLSKEETQGEG